MAPINKKIRAVIKKYNSDAENSTINSYTTPTIVTTSNITAVITTASSSLQNGQFADSNNTGFSDSDQTESNSRQSVTPQSDESSFNLARDKNYPNLSFVGHPRRSTSILSPLSVRSHSGKLLHSVSSRPETSRNINVDFNHQCIVPSPASSPFDSHSQPFSVSSSSSPSPSPSTSTQDKFADSPSNDFLYENGTRRKSVISAGDRSSPNTSRKETYDESSNEQQHAFNLHSSYKHSTKTTEGSSSSGQSGKITLDKSSEEYRIRRERNNIAVRKSRHKSKEKIQQTIERMNQLEAENLQLHKHIAKMSQELAVFKFLLEKYQDENFIRIMKLDNGDAMEIPAEIRMSDRVEIGSDRFQIRNFGNSRSNMNPFYPER